RLLTRSRARLVRTAGVHFACVRWRERDDRRVVRARDHRARDRRQLGSCRAIGRFRRLRGGWIRIDRADPRDPRDGAASIMMPEWLHEIATVARGVTIAVTPLVMLFLL